MCIRDRNLGNDYIPSGVEAVRPVDYNTTTNTRIWVLVSTWDSPKTVSGVVVNQTKTKYKEINIEFLPDGVEVSDSETIEEIGSPSNNVRLPWSLNHHDLSQEINNGEKLFLSYLKLSDGTPTSNWTIVGETVSLSIQNQLIKWITRLIKRTRAIISGNFRVDGLEFTPLNVLYDPGDTDRLYLPTGVNSNFKEQEYSGELVEIGSGDQVSTSSYSNGFQQNAFR
jgi:hypothetical protein